MPKSRVVMTTAFGVCTDWLATFFCVLMRFTCTFVRSVFKCYYCVEIVNNRYVTCRRSITCNRKLYVSSFAVALFSKFVLLLMSSSRLLCVVWCGTMMLIGNVLCILVICCMLCIIISLGNYIGLSDYCIHSFITCVMCNIVYCVVTCNSTMQHQPCIASYSCSARLFQ